MFLALVAPREHALAQPTPPRRSRGVLQLLVGAALGRRARSRARLAREPRHPSNSYPSELGHAPMDGSRDPCAFTAPPDGKQISRNQDTAFLSRAEWMSSALRQSASNS